MGSHFDANRPGLLLQSERAVEEFDEQVRAAMLAVEAEQAVMDAAQRHETAKAHESKLTGALARLQERAVGFTTELNGIDAKLREALVSDAGSTVEDKVLKTIVFTRTLAESVSRAIDWIGVFGLPSARIEAQRSNGLLYRAKAQVLEAIIDQRLTALVEQLGPAVRTEATLSIDSNSGVTGRLRAYVADWYETSKKLLEDTRQAEIRHEEMLMTLEANKKGVGR